MYFMCQPLCIAVGNGSTWELGEKGNWSGEKKMHMLSIIQLTRACISHWPWQMNKRTPVGVPSCLD